MNVLEITLKNKQINEILQDDLFIRAFEHANEAGFVTCTMLQREYSISYPKARAFYEVMSLFKNRRTVCAYMGRREFYGKRIFGLEILLSRKARESCIW